MSGHRLTFPELDRSVTCRDGDTIFQAARRAGVRIVGACGGRGTCGTCAVRVQDDGHAQRKWQRACQVVPHGDCSVQVAPRSLAPVVRTDTAAGGATEILALDPLVEGHDVDLPPATLDDTRADLDRLADALALPDLAADLAVARVVPQALRGNGWSVRAFVGGGRLVAVAPRGRHALGLAIDLGTTNIAAFLVDLRNGLRLASLGIENPQTAWGGDLISRINHAAADPAAAEDLRAAAVDGINGLAHDLCAATGAEPADIVDVAVCANTAMHHLLLGLPVRQLGRAPFVAALREATEVRARDLGLVTAPGASVHLAPNIGGFVGGDHVAALLATAPHWRERATSLVMDIGTNTEISLIHRGAILSASCPSGPALEGGNISCGMRAAEGAIERVTAVDGRLWATTIDGKPAVGVCGSGVLDAVAALRRAGAVDEGGRLAADHPDVAEAQGGRAAVLAPEVHFTQHDVRALQLAKSAIRTGVAVLLDEAGLAERDIERFIVAGAFGAHVGIESGIAIGLFPPLPLERFEQVGNAAGMGVRQLLASRRARDEARRLAAHCRYVELSTRADFQKRFLRNIRFA